MTRLLRRWQTWAVLWVVMTGSYAAVLDQLKQTHMEQVHYLKQRLKNDRS